MENLKQTYSLNNRTDLDPEMVFCSLKLKNFLKKEIPLNRYNKKDTAKILIVRANARGDVIQVTPILREIKKQYPNITIDVLTKYPEIFENNPNVNKIRTDFEQDFKKYDRVYFLQYELNPNLHVVDAYARCVGIEIQDYKPEIFLTKEEIGWAADYLDKNNIRNNFVAVCAESSWACREWTLYEWSMLIKKIKDSFDFQTVELGLNGRFDKLPEIGEKSVKQLFGLSFRQTAAIIKHSKFFVGVDGGLVHLAVALNKPTFGIFGIVDPNKKLPDKWLPLATQHNGYSAGIMHRIKPINEFGPKNYKLTCEEDMKLIRHEEIFEKIVKHVNVMNFGIAITTYNNSDMLFDCVMSILDKSSDWNYNICIGDDGSKPYHKENLKKLRRLVNIVGFDNNVGYTKNTNRLIFKMVNEIIILMNDDTKLITENWLSMFDKCLNDPYIGVVGAKLLYPDNTIQHAGGIFEKEGIFAHLYKGLPRDYKYANVSRILKAVTGAVYAFRKEDWIKLNGYDEEYKQSAEDADFCLRMKRDLHRDTMYCHEIELYHYEGKTLGLNKSFDKDNIQRLKNKFPNLIDDVSKFVDDKGALPLPYYNLELGCGLDANKGYIHADIYSGDERGQLPHLEFFHDIRDRLPIADNCVKEILANHVIEHIGWRQVIPTLRDWKRVLVKGGCIKLRTPNMKFICEKYLKNEITREHPDDEKFIKDNFRYISPSMWANLKLYSGQGWPANFHQLCLDQYLIEFICLNVLGFERIIPWNEREYSPGELRMAIVK